MGFLRKSTFHAKEDYNRLVSGSFNLRLGILFSFQSPYLFAIGLLRYLELGVDASHLHAAYPNSTTLFLNQLFGIPLQDYHLLRYAFPGNFESTN